MRRAVRLFVELVRFEHTVFALPFAYMGALLAANGRPTGWEWGWITVAMVCARTAGMALNRLIDADIDAKNPRTRSRTLPRGAMRRETVWWLAGFSMAGLVGAATQLQPICVGWSPVAVLLLVMYSYLKRFTRYAHLGVGLVLACAPVGAWMAIRNTIDLPILLLGAAVMVWVAGFDILYACQDIDFDRAEGLHSVPQALGAARALSMAQGCHALSFILLVLLGAALHLGPCYFAGVTSVGALLVYEHRLVKPQDLSRLDQAFFNVNGWISVTLFLATLAHYHFK
ncbi:MAG TPA: UbiA-like polyprenyltransferase [Candidatus Xenobia bacterium]|jgi:4-hydroxybenzoate polyprenyltransferase